MSGNRKKGELFQKPWVAVATGAGVLIIVICAVVFLSGGSAGLDTSASPGTADSARPPAERIVAHAAAPSGTPGELSYNVVMTDGYELSDAVIPGEGVFIRVIYRGGYAGTWVSGNGTGEIRNSGERVFAVENPGNMISVDMLKLDNSWRQQMAVEIWKDNTLRASNSTVLPYGEVTVSTGL